ncbi:MAG: hypothetical protein KBD53_00780 [Candidatus Omnitrophica bacterium]|nr:hypothetical protein [Candidatus Omnitrophota bacterium]
MDDEAAKIMKIIIIILAVSYGLKLWFSRGSDIYKGPGYTIKFPAGWSDYDDINPQKKKDKKFATEDKAAPKTVTYVTQEVDEDSGAFVASMSITSMKLKSAAWIEDEWGQIVESIRGYGNKIIDKGEIKIDGIVSRWIFYEGRPGENAVSFEFYIITEGNMFYKISYMALKNSFDKYRKIFEASKDTIRIKQGMI